jgi:hypothetical protein
MVGDPWGGYGPQVTDGNGRKCRDARGPDCGESRWSVGSLSIASALQGINYASHWTSPAKEALLSMTW